MHTQLGDISENMKEISRKIIEYGQREFVGHEIFVAYSTLYSVYFNIKCIFTFVFNFIAGVLGHFIGAKDYRG